MAEMILVVDDEEDLADLLVFNLERNGFQATKALSGREAVDLAQRIAPKLVILDLMLPDIDGLEVFRQLRKSEKTANVPVIMLTAKADEVDRVVGLELGADDYVTKPFSTREVMLRVKGLLRRVQPSVEGEKSGLIEFGPFRIDPDRFEVFIEEQQVVLTSTEFRLLHELITRRGKVLTRTHLLENVWGYVHNVTDRTVDTHIKRLRQKIGEVGSAYIETIRGVGYRFADTDRPPVAERDEEEEASEHLGLL